MVGSLLDRDTTTSMRVKVINAGRRSLLPSFSEVYDHRELIVLFVDRHIKSRYRQMALGIAWALLEPLFQLLLMSVVFGFLLRVNTNGYPYPVYVFAALIPWQHFTRTAMSVTGSLQDNLSLISKVYFPRIILPIAAMAREMFDTAIQLAILLILAAFYGYYPSLKLVLLAPVVLILISFAGAGLGLWAAAIVVRFRDVRPALSIALQGGLYLTPILYAASVVPQNLRFLYQLNPMYWGVETFRWLLIDQPLVWDWTLPVSLTLTAIMTALGIVIFSVNERTTVDVL